MSSDPVVIALRNAASVGDGVELRLALGRRLLELGQPEEALAEFESALGFDPGRPALLELAATAARTSGNSAKSRAYEVALAAHVEGRQQPRDSPPVGSEQKVQAEKGKPLLRLVTDADSRDEDGTQRITFDDVGGHDQLKKRLERSFLLPLRQPAIYAKFDRSMRGGLLLYGPPGCGKTFIARALAGEIGARFQSIALSDVLDLWFGESERKLHEMFETARRRAPTLLFFDEVDALGQRRANLARSGFRSIANQLLAELDGVSSDNRDVFVLGATNHPWDVDPALRRPGRFGRLVFVPGPDWAAREQILRLKIARRPSAPDLDLKRWAQKTAGFSGADLEALIDAATDLAFEKTVESGKDHVVDDNLLRTAFQDARPSIGPWLETARSYAVYANEGGTYDDLLEYLRTRGET